MPRSRSPRRVFSTMNQVRVTLADSSSSHHLPLFVAAAIHVSEAAILHHEPRARASASETGVDRRRAKRLVESRHLRKLRKDDGVERRRLWQRKDVEIGKKVVEAKQPVEEGVRRRRLHDGVGKQLQPVEGGLGDYYKITVRYCME